ncbi:MAG TPA: AbrB family transcriptional regulator [Azospirillum sp.]|nr:AbrB family transcriptional regulator [Azospirillum sp.]
MMMPVLGRLALALLIGTAGGALLNHFNMPLAWMIGAMLFTSAAAMAHLPVAVPPALRAAMIIVLGVMLGSGFTPAILSHLGEWTVTLSGLVAYIAAATALGLAYLRRVAGYDPVTAYFTATPGGLNEMVMVGTSMGGDGRTIALVHTLRVMLVVMVIPFWFQALGYYQPGQRGPLGPDLTAVPALDLALLASCAVGYPIARALRVPAAQIVGPMLLSAAIHLAGITAGKPPGVLVAVAQVVVGSALGCRFVGVRLHQIGRAALVSLGGTVLMLLLALAFGSLLHGITGLGMAGLILAFAPGGLAEMSLVALALGVDVAFVSTHHVVRIVLIVTLAPAVFLLWRRLARRYPSNAAADD